MAAKWNARPAYTEKPLLGSQVSKSAALQSAASYGAVAVVAALSSTYGLPLLNWLHVPHVTAIGTLLGLLIVLGLGGAVAAVLRWRESNARAKAQAGLAPGQRKLLGLPPTPPPTAAPPPEAAPAAARAATLLATPVTPAQRMAIYTPVSDVAPRQLLATPGSAGRSSYTASPSRISPWSSGPAVATPDQVNRYLAQYAEPTPQQPPEQAMFEGGLYGGGFGGGAAGMYGDADQGAAHSPSLPLGRDAPAYRPSLWPRKAAASAAGPDGMASAETNQFMEQVLQINVATSAPTQLTWIERLREWLASELLQPLAQHIMTAHELPNQAISAFGQNNAKDYLLPPIPELLGLDVPTRSQTQQQYGLSSSALALPGAGAGGLMMQAWNLPGMLGGSRGQNPSYGSRDAGQGSAQQGQSVAVVDDAIRKAQSLRDQLYGVQLMQRFDPQELRMALHRYSELLLLLTGRRPSELLPATPPSYIANRVLQLAQTTCVKDFNWNGGGEHAGHPWTPELPNDSALLFYLFAAYVASPGWNFPPGAAGPDNSRGAPLFIGSVPGNPTTEYSALLAYKPDKPTQTAAVMVATQMTSREPRFALMLLGQQFSLCERDGFFKVLLWWLRFHLLQRRGLLGGRSLDEDVFGGLQSVLADDEQRPTVPQRVFNWWYPKQ